MNEIILGAHALNLVFGLWSKYLMELDYVTYYFGWTILVWMTVYLSTVLFIHVFL